MAGMTSNDKPQLDEIGAGIVGKAVTDTLYVSPNGDNSNGKTWAAAFNTIEEALDAASVSSNDCTLICVSPSADSYDINRTGDPTFTGNYIIQGPQKHWVTIKNSHASATSILKFTGKAYLIDITIDCGTGSNNGVIFSGPGANGGRLERIYVESEDVTGANEAILLEGGIKYIELKNIFIHGVVTYTKALSLDNCSLSIFRDMQVHTSLTGLQISNTLSDSNEFYESLFHTCELALDLNGGNAQLFDHINFINNTKNIDDEVGDHNYHNIHNGGAMLLLPDNFTGVELPASADVWGNNTVLVGSATLTCPFRVIGITLEPSAAEKYRVRISDDGGVTHFIDLQIEGSVNISLRLPVNLPSGTEQIFNQNIELSGSAKSESGSNTIKVWVTLQEIC